MADHPGESCYFQTLVTILLLSWSWLSWPCHVQQIARHISQYRRPLTLLEIGPSLKYLSSPSESGVVKVHLTLKEHLAALEANKDLIVLAPPTVTMAMLHGLGCCEHFDIVIVHRCSAFGMPLVHLVGLCMQLADHLFIEVDTPNLARLLDLDSRVQCCEPYHEESPGLYLLSTTKQHLWSARYTREAARIGEPPYCIHSTYDVKYFIKHGTSRPWVPGINLVTFCMLYGVSPTDSKLRSELYGLHAAGTVHNDFVLGNLILSGHTLVPIDGSDPRKRLPFKEGYRCALTAFGDGNTRLDDPEGWMKQYVRDIRESTRL